MPTLAPEEARRRFASATVAYLATLRADGTAALVPIVFEVIGDRVVSLIDPKPKRTPELARLRHIARDPRVALLVDHYEDDWTRLWWVRVGGTGRVVEQSDHGLERLAHGKRRSQRSVSTGA